MLLRMCIEIKNKKVKAAEFSARDALVTALEKLEKKSYNPVVLLCFDFFSSIMQSAALLKLLCS